MSGLLVADVGATNARFALAVNGKLEAVRILACAEHDNLEALIAAYLADLPVPPRLAALALAGPIDGDRADLTNLGWRVSLAGLQRRFGLHRLEAINDFAAVALAVPRLDRKHRVPIGNGRGAAAGAPMVVLGPGSGLGVCGLFPDPTGALHPVSGEAGHATMPANDTREAAVLEQLRRRPEFDGHVSAERLLSGPGLINLYRTLCALDRRRPQRLLAAEIADPAFCAEEPACAEAVQMFCAMLGGFAGNLALTFGARGGVYIAGGIVPKLGAATLRRSGFRARFEAKGRFRRYLQRIPSFLITHPFPALLGLAGLELTNPASAGAARTNGRAAREPNARPAR
jgi:glucokinase